MIIARYDVILDQSVRMHLYNHLINYTNMVLVNMGVSEVRLNNREKSSSFLLHSRLVLHLWVVQLCTYHHVCVVSQVKMHL